MCCFVIFKKKIFQGGILGNDDFTFPKKIFFLKITKQHTASLISTLNTGETSKIKLTNYFILRMRLFIQNFTNIVVAKNYLRKVLESTIFKP